MKDWICKHKRLSKNKTLELQIGHYTKEIEKTSIFQFKINITRRIDHAGFNFIFELFIFYIFFNIIDNRHWLDKDDK